MSGDNGMSMRKLLQRVSRIPVKDLHELVDTWEARQKLEGSGIYYLKHIEKFCDIDYGKSTIEVKKPLIQVTRLERAYMRMAKDAGYLILNMKP